MPTITLKAHYDGEHIVLDEPCELLPNTALMVTVLPSAEAAPDERAAWAAFSTRHLTQAYGDDEPDYSLADIKEA